MNTSIAQKNISMLLTRACCVAALLVDGRMSTISCGMGPLTHQPYSRDDDLYLWRHQNEDLEEVAAALGRGKNSLTGRLKRLRNPKTEGYQRLFGPDEDDCLEEDGCFVKGEKLRPFRECVQRIVYDPSVSSSDFRVGYKDRFRTAPCEVALDAPNDSISGHARSLVDAMPEHRIEYLKFKKRLVWHKAQRLDKVFGGSDGMRLAQAIETYGDWDDARRSRVRRARVRALAAFGSGGAKKKLDAFRKLVGRVKEGQMGSDAFVEAALSEQYFGANGCGAAVEPVEGAAAARSVEGCDDEEEEQQQDADNVPAVIELVATLPDEHAELRDKLLSELSSRLGL